MARRKQDREWRRDSRGIGLLSPRAQAKQQAMVNEVDREFRAARRGRLGRLTKVGIIGGVIGFMLGKLDS